MMPMQPITAEFRAHQASEAPLRGQVGGIPPKLILSCRASTLGLLQCLVDGCPACDDVLLRDV